ncbi:MAG: exonuclease domain-containing protein [Lachnospiraceae bacterium]|nr:exonuclease domain-containing protein [Lachnospiraceae bacterium]
MLSHNFPGIEKFSNVWYDAINIANHFGSGRMICGTDTVNKGKQGIIVRHIIVDLEMNGIAKEHEMKGSTHKEIIEIGAVMLDENYNEIGTFMTYVKPELNDTIESRYSSLTGITTAMVQDAPVFGDAIRAFADWCSSYDDEFTLYQWSDNDRMQIVSEMNIKNFEPGANENKLMGKWVDFQKEFSRLLGLSKPVALEKAIDYAGEAFQGRQHDALYDARNTASLFIMSRDEEKFKKELKYIIDAINTQKSEDEASIGDMVDFGSIKELIGGSDVQHED